MQAMERSQSDPDTLWYANTPVTPIHFLLFCGTNNISCWVPTSLWVLTWSLNKMGKLMSVYIWDCSKPYFMQTITINVCLHFNHDMAEKTRDPATQPANLNILLNAFRALCDALATNCQLKYPAGAMQHGHPTGVLACHLMNVSSLTF